jgi:hypothetical protein
MSYFFENSPLRTIADLAQVAANHKKVVVFTNAKFAEQIAAHLEGGNSRLLSAFARDGVSPTRSSLIVDAGLADHIVLLLPEQWVHGYRLEGVSSVVFAGVSVNRNSAQYRQAILRANAARVDVYFLDSQIMPVSLPFDRPVVFGDPAPRPAVLPAQI